MPTGLATRGDGVAWLAHSPLVGKRLRLAGAVDVPEPGFYPRAHRSLPEPPHGPEYAARETLFLRNMREHPKTTLASYVAWWLTCLQTRG